MHARGKPKVKDFNTHNLYLRTGQLTKDQVDSSFRSLIEQLCESKLLDEGVQFENNVLYSKGIPIGVTYCWVSSSKLYWILLGHNPDGSERVKEYLDPNWVPKERVEKKIICWGDEDDDEQPIIREKLDPIAKLPTVKYSPQQYIDLLAEMRGAKINPLEEEYGEEIYEDDDYSDDEEEDEQKTKLRHDILLMRKMAKVEKQYFRFKLGLVGENFSEEAATLYAEQYEFYRKEQPDFINVVSEHASIEVLRSDANMNFSNVLVCKNIPPWVHKSDLIPLFSKFSEDKTLIRSRKVSVPKFPKINVGDWVNRKGLKTVTVEFKTGLEASFCLQMRKVIKFAKGNRSTVLFFAHQEENRKGRNHNRRGRKRY